MTTEGGVETPVSASRPFMPGYGVAAADEGRGLLPWSWAEERLVRSHDYWLATVRPDCRPHVMPVWAVWRSGALLFSSSVGSRKVRNLDGERRCVITTDNALEPVVVEGTAERVTDRSTIEEFLAASNAKYDTGYGMDFLDPAVNATVRIRPTLASALTSKTSPAPRPGGRSGADRAHNRPAAQEMDATTSDAMGTVRTFSRNPTCVAGRHDRRRHGRLRSGRCRRRVSPGRRRRRCSARR